MDDEKKLCGAESEARGVVASCAERRKYDGELQFNGDDTNGSFGDVTMCGRPLELRSGKKVSNKARRGEARLVSAATAGGSRGGCGGVGSRRGEVIGRLVEGLRKCRKTHDMVRRQ